MQAISVNFFSTLACPVLSCAHYFQAPATRANKTVMFRENGLCYKSVYVDKVSNEEAILLLFSKQGSTL